MPSSLAERWSATKAQAELLAKPRTLRTRKSDVMSLATAGGNLAGFDGHSYDTHKAREQYEHYRGRVFSAIRVITSRVSCQPLMVGRLKGRLPATPQRSSNYHLTKDMLPSFMKGLRPDKLDILDTHPLVTAFENPNELMTSSMLWQVTVASLLITGRGFWYLSKEKRGWTIAPIPTTWMHPIHEPGRLFAKWDIYPPGYHEKKITVPDEAICHFYFPDPDDPLGAVSPLEMQAHGVLADEAIAQAQHATFANGNFPSHALIAGKLPMKGGGESRVRMNDDQRRQLLMWYRQQYQGAQKFGLPFILDAMIEDIKPLTVNPKEMAFLESSGLTKTLIYEGFGVNPVSAGQVEGSNRASSAIADTHLAANAVNPIIDLISQVMTKTAVPFFTGDNRLKMWIQPVIPFDPQMELDWARLLARHSACTGNELRAMSPMRLNPDERFEEPVGKQEQGQGSVNQPSESDIERDGVFETEDTKPDPEENPDNGREDADNGAKSHRCHWNKGTKDARKQRWIKQHEAGEKRLATEFERFFIRQLKDAAQRLQELSVEKSWTKARSDAVLQEVFNPRQWDQRLRDTVEPLLGDLMAAGAASELASHSKQFDFDAFQFQPHVVQRMQESLTELLSQSYWSDMNDVTREHIAKSVEAGFKESLTLGDVANRILDEAPQLGRVRAIRAARTETTQVLNAGHDAVIRALHQEGIVGTKEWMAILDEDTRGADADDDFSHVAADGQVVKATENFLVSGEEAPYPGHFSLSAGSRINCRCTSTGIPD